MVRVTPNAPSKSSLGEMGRGVGEEGSCAGAAGAVPLAAASGKRCSNSARRRTRGKPLCGFVSGSVRHPDCMGLPRGFCQAPGVGTHLGDGCRRLRLTGCPEVSAGAASECCNVPLLAKVALTVEDRVPGHLTPQIEQQAAG